MRASRRTEKSVRNVIEHLADPDVVLFGTGVHEKRVGWKQIRSLIERDWAQSDTARMTFDSLNISSAGSSACAAASGRIERTLDDQTMSIPMRLTATLENRAGKWVMIQMHFSTPTPEPDGPSYMQ